MLYSGGNMILADINKERLLKTFTELLQVNSPSFNEKEIRALLKRRLRERG